MRKGFVLHWNGPPAGVVGHRNGHARCEAYWRAVRAYHVGTKGWSDIAYSFGACPCGVAFGLENGWTKRQFANGLDVVGQNDGPDSEWFTILYFIGEGEQPTKAMLDTGKWLIAEGRRTGRAGMRVLPHKDFKVKGCPGPELTQLSREWDNRDFGDDVALTDLQNALLAYTHDRVKQIHEELPKVESRLRKLIEEEGDGTDQGLAELEESLASLFGDVAGGSLESVPTAALLAELGRRVAE